MEIPGLARLHEETLREISRSLSLIIANEDRRTLQNLLQRTFNILNLSAKRYPETALKCIHKMGKEIYKIGEFHLVDSYQDMTISFGFQYPRPSGVTEDWQFLVNSAHLKNIRVWLDLIKANPGRSKKLLSALVINLSLGGVFIKDTDLFPRDVTGLLNSDIEPVYNLELIRK
jgi:pyruvate,orthophosphate dikinase